MNDSKYSEFNSKNNDGGLIENNEAIDAEKINDMILATMEVKGEGCLSKKWDHRDLNNIVISG